MTAAELAAIEARMNRSYTEGIRQDGLELCAEVRRLTAEVARLSSALDAAARVVARKAARERGESEKDPTISDGGGA